MGAAGRQQRERGVHEESPSQLTDLRLGQLYLPPRGHLRLLESPVSKIIKCKSALASRLSPQFPQSRTHESSMQNGVCYSEFSISVPMNSDLSYVVASHKNAPVALASGLKMAWCVLALNFNPVTGVQPMEKSISQSINQSISTEAAVLVGARF